MGHHKSCGCEACRTKRRRQVKLRILGKAGWVPIDEVADLFDRLATQGYSYADIGHAAGLNTSKVSKYRRRKQPTLVKAVADRILAADYTRRLPSTLIPAEPSIRRVRALCAIGWRVRLVAEMAGLPESTVGSLASGQVKQTRYKVAAAIDSIYDEISGTPGDCQRSRIVAKRKGWLPPLAWDNIDDLTERPKPRRLAG